jgi:hypothetical protein
LALRDEKGGYVPIGTGFLLAHPFGGRSFNCLVTAKHVIMKDDGQLRNDVFIVANKKTMGIDALQLSVLSHSGIVWKAHAEKDVGIIPIPVIPKIHDLKRLSSDLVEDFSNVREGDEIFFLGFPLSLGATPSRVTPIVRGGMVAMKNEDETFLIDANVFPGNSGSPVFFKPCPFTSGPTGLKLGQIRPPKLIGIVTSYLPYEEVAVSPQTGRARASFQENSGLASVLSMRFIREVLTSSDFQTMLQEILDKEKTTQSPIDQTSPSAPKS